MKFKAMLLGLVVLASTSAQANNREAYCTQSLYDVHNRYYGQVRFDVRRSFDTGWNSPMEVTLDLSDIRGMRFDRLRERTIKVQYGGDRWGLYNTQNMSSIVRFDGGSDTAHSYVTIRDDRMVRDLEQALGRVEFPRHRDQFGREIPGLNGLKVEQARNYWSFRDLNCR